MLTILAKENLPPHQGPERSCLAPTPRSLLLGAETFQDAALAVAFEGTLYNTRELLGLVQASPSSTAELIAALYERFGLDLLLRLNGPCAVSILDKRTGRASVATDRYGICPVVYLAQPGRLVCAGRIREILAVPGADPGELDHGAVLDYLNLSAIPSPRTVYRQVRKLPPGHLLTVSEGDLEPRLTKYYDLDYAPKGWREAEVVARLPLDIEQAVRSIVEAEQGAGRRVGAFLSGGTDSSTVAGMIAKVAGGVETFSIGFDEPGYSELDYARVAASRFGARHHEYTVTPEDVLSAIGALVDAFDEPFGNASAVPTYFCAKLAREQGVDTLLAGDGGDEIFGGNERYAAGKVFSDYHRIPSLLRKGFIEPLISLAPSAHPVLEKGKKYIRRANIPQPDRFFSYHPVASLGAENLFSPEFLRGAAGHDLNAWARELWDGAGTRDELNRLLYLDMKFTITDNDLRKVTGMVGQAGIRVAYPFLDHRLVDYAAGIPSGLKVKGRALRYVFKEALKGFLPPEIIVKQKHGFGLPIGVWTRSKENIASFVRETLLGPSCGIRPWLRDGVLEEIFRIHVETGATFYGDVIWNLLVLELWRQRSGARQAAPPPGAISQVHAAA